MLRRLVTLALAVGLVMSIMGPASAAGGGTVDNGYWSADGETWYANPDGFLTRATRQCYSFEKPVAQILIKDRSGDPNIAFLDYAVLKMVSDEIGGPGYKQKDAGQSQGYVDGSWDRLDLTLTPGGGTVNMQVTGPDSADVYEVGEGATAQVQFRIESESKFKVRLKIWCANA